MPDSYAKSPFSTTNRLSRALWGFVCLLLFRYSPRPFHRWRAIILRLFGAKVGKNVHVYPKVRIWAPWTIELGDECGIANGVNLYSQARITIGNRAVISQDSFICTGTHDYTKKGHPLITRPIVIKDHAWIAAEVFVHPGITIGEGAVVGARSVVTSNMPDWMVCTGHPCKPIKPRTIDSPPS